MPSDRFREWARKYGIRKLARDLIKTYGRSVSPTTVHFWVNAKPPRRPKYDVGIAVIRLAKDQGQRLTFSDVFGAVEI
jgi:hypothetical protein